MAATIRNPWKNAATSNEKYARKVVSLEKAIEYTKSVLAWQMAEGYEPQAENSRKELAELEARLAKLMEA